MTVHCVHPASPGWVRADGRGPESNTNFEGPYARVIPRFACNARSGVSPL
ncbi:MAG: hypothetical protein QOJ80_1110 [Mycobacterium sp.]|jgi:hypothetical protein|nr:hypothetical protein [Mycobacterium sp.]